MTWWLWVLAGLGVYSTVGVVFALQCLPALWARPWTRTSPDGYELQTSEAQFREHVVECAVVRWVAWPIMLPVELLTRRADATDPGALQRSIRELEAQNAELRRIQEGGQ